MKKYTKFVILLLLCVTLATVVSAESTNTEEELTINGSVEMTFYSQSSTVGQSGYCLSLEYNGNVYYISTENYDKMISSAGESTSEDASSMTSDGINEQLNEMGVDTYSQDMDDSNLKIEYETGQKVDNDDNANVITHWYNTDGTQIL